MVELDTSESEIWEADFFVFKQGFSYLVEAESGKGKTSLLSMLFGLRKDYHGEIYLDQNNIRNNTASDWSKLRKNQFSYIFQGLELFDDLSALENIMLKNRITTHKSNKEIFQMAHMLNVGDFLHKQCRILSFGQKQRIAIIRALCQPFNFLLADECFSHIDSRHSEMALELILSECKANNAGLILTSLGSQNMKLDQRVKL